MLQAFEAKARASGLPWTFAGRSDFRKRFADHLQKMVPQLLAQVAKSKAKKPKPTVINLIATGTGNVQLGGDGKILHIGSIKVPRDSRGKSVRDLPGTIGAAPDMRTYAKYLVDTYIVHRMQNRRREADSTV